MYVKNNPVYMSFYHLQLWNQTMWFQALWVKYMSLAWWLPELIRELRWLGSSSCSGCPWGAIALAIVVCALACCTLGFCLGGLFFFCRLSQDCSHLNQSHKPGSPAWGSSTA